MAEIKHIAVIIDGNRRYAKAKNLPTFKGHEEGAAKIKDLLKWCKELEIKETTIYTLSTENLKREQKELDALFSLFKKFFKELKKDKDIHKNKVKIRFIGNLSLVPKEIKELAEEMEKETKDYDNYIINFCFAYGGRSELVNAFNQILKNKSKSESKITEINEEDITNSLWLKSQPDFVIRTGGKTRTSNFLPWQTVYSEWFFLEKMWPDFTKQDLLDCIAKFQVTQRNFGK